MYNYDQIKQNYHTPHSTELLEPHLKKNVGKSESFHKRVINMVRDLEQVIEKMVERTITAIFFF